MAADGDGQEQRAEDFPLQSIAVQADRQRDCADKPAERNRRRHQDRVPNDASLNLERSHAGVVHCRDTAAHHGAADPSPRPPIRGYGDRQARAGQHDCGDQRENRQRDIVGARHSRRKRQHRNEMRRPDPESRRRGRDHQPNCTHASTRSADVVEQADSGERGKRADHRCETDKPKFMFGDDAVVYG